ncbi:hypothetical protein DL544_05830 [Stenotrophomonas sp. pho]|nr:hypothetical protein DL544_05830 [Stenotrophomonas sp. pho]
MAGNVFSNLLRPFIRQKDTELPGVAPSEPPEPPVRERLDDSSQRPVASAEPATLSPVEGPQSVPFNDEATDRLGSTLAFAGLKTKGRFEDEVRQAIEDGADVKGYRDSRGDSALHKCQEPWQMELLISAGADVHALDKQGRSPFDRLLSTYQREPAWSEKPTAEGLALLAKAGADVNALSQGQSALHVAAKRGLEGDIHMLVDAGADVNLRADGETPRSTWPAI